MQEAGMDLSQPCDIEFSHLFEHESEARSLAAEAESMGARVEVFEPEELDEEEEIEESVWDVVCTFTMVPTHEALTARETELAMMAQRLGGRADGWGVMHG
jgi:regulator of RNase E activity RraB